MNTRLNNYEREFLTYVLITYGNQGVGIVIENTPYDWKPNTRRTVLELREAGYMDKVDRRHVVSEKALKELNDESTAT